MLEWPRYSVYNTGKYLDLRKKIKNPGKGTPKAWAYPWCVLNSDLSSNLLSLDFGCGSWTNFSYFISSITSSLTIGVDTGNLQKDEGNTRFFKTKPDKLEFPSNFFDRIFSVSVLEHVPLDKRKNILEEIFRVLRPGGLAVITIDWIFNLTPKIALQLANSNHLNRIGSRIYGNYNFSKLIIDYAHVVKPLLKIDKNLLPGTKQFNEDMILNDNDILIKGSERIGDVDYFKYTTVGLILKKHNIGS